jgi:hypothetical protein
MRDKFDDSLDPEFFNASEFQNVSAVQRRMRGSATYQAGIAALCALAAASPAVSAQLSKSFYHWMVIAAGVGVARAAYGYLIAHSWEEQLAEFRADRIQRLKEAEARAELVRAINESPVSPGGFEGWTKVRGELQRPH